MEILKTHKLYSQGADAEAIVEVPGVNRYSGLFAESSNGAVLCSTNVSCLSVAFSKRSDGILFCTNSLTGEHKKFSISSLKYKKEDKWSNYIKGIFASSDINIKKFTGATITLEGSLLSADTELIKGSVSVGVLSAIKKVYNLSMDTEKIIQILRWVFVSFCSESFPYPEIYTILFSKKNCFVYMDLDDSDFKLLSNPFKKSSEYGFYILDGRIPPGPIREEFQFIKDSLNKSMHQFVQIYKKRSFKGFDINKLRGTVFMSSENFFSSEQKKMCKYMYSEAKNTELLAASLKDEDAVVFGRMLNKNQKDIKEFLELICPEIDWIIKRANENSICLGSSVALNGNSAIVSFIIKNSDTEFFFQKIQQYEHIFGFKNLVYTLEDSKFLRYLKADEVE